MYRLSIARAAANMTCPLQQSAIALQQMLEQNRPRIDTDSDEWKSCEAQVRQQFDQQVQALQRQQQTVHQLRMEAEMATFAAEANDAAAVVIRLTMENIGPHGLHDSDAQAQAWPIEWERMMEARRQWDNQLLAQQAGFAASAAEAIAVARRFGNEVTVLQDVGVAGLHRLLASHDVLRDARVLIVVAGMEGALPSVVGGLVDKPVIAVPTSIGYGASLGGLAALLGMLTSCASNVSVVNIDNGFGAAHVATLINRL